MEHNKDVAIWHEGSKKKKKSFILLLKKKTKQRPFHFYNTISKKMSKFGGK